MLILLFLSMLGALVVTPTVDPIQYAMNCCFVGVVAGFGYWLGKRKR
jgi:hypothetical protein